MLSILLLTCAIAAPRLNRTLEKQKSNAARIEMKSLFASLKVHRMENNEYPQKLETLVEQGLLKPKDIQDPWYETYLYEPVKDKNGKFVNYKMASKGPDKVAGTDDDIQCKGHAFALSEGQRKR